ncbi:MAG: hypothetical protein JWN04_4303 [Myxococcaceae bacterium]|nr:hypothetical protein [Myxococcaceae bacterium]
MSFTSSGVRYSGTLACVGCLCWDMRDIEHALPTVRMAERNKRPGVQYALTDDGVELPVIDITHPAFLLSLEPALLQAMSAGFLVHARMRARMPAFLYRFLLRKSVLAQHLREADERSFLGGVETYLFKLGPENLGSMFPHPIDRKIAASIPAVSMRLRLQDMARLMADAVLPMLTTSEAARPLILINLAGGPSIDSLNAVILLQQERPELLANRPVRIHALDLEPKGASFGARALAALREPGSPLHGLDVSLTYRHYDWTQAADLSRTLEQLTIDGAPVVALSSEGGLFEYGDDQAVMSNLRAVHASTPVNTTVTGSVTSDNELIRLFQKTSRVPLQPRSAAAFEGLVESAGFTVMRSIERPLCRDVQLAKR